MDRSEYYNGTSAYQQPLNSNTLPNRYKGMVQVLPTSVFLQSQKPVNGYNGSDTRNFTQSNFNVGFTPTMTVTSDVPRIRPPPPSPRANVQQRKGRDEKSRAAFHKSMFDLRDVGQDSFQRPQQPQSMAPTAELMTSTPKPGYPCYDRHSLNLSYQDLRQAGNVYCTPQVQQQSTHSQTQNTHHNQQNIHSLNTGLFDNRAFPNANFTPIAKQPELQYFKQQLPPITQTRPTIQNTKLPNLPAVNTQNNDMKSLHDDMAQLRLELDSMKVFMREEEEFQSKQVQELEQLQKQLHESSKLIQEQKPKKEREPPKFNSLPTTITSTPSPKSTPLPPKSPKPTLKVKPTGGASKVSGHPNFTSMKNPIKELEERFNMQTKPEETPNKQSQQATEPKKLPLSKLILSSNAPVFPTTTYSTPPKSPKPATSVKPPSNQLRRSFSVTPTNPSQQAKPTQRNQIVFPKTGPLVPPTKPELLDQIHGDKNNNCSTTPSNNSTGETKSKPIASSNAKVKRISQMFELNLNEANDTGPQQKGSLHYDAKIGGGTIRKLSPALLQSIQASEESKLLGSQASSRKNSNSANLKSNLEVQKLEPPNIPGDLSEFPSVPPVLKSSPALSQVASATKPSALPPLLKHTPPSNEPYTPVKQSQVKNTLPLLRTSAVPPSPPPVSLKPASLKSSSTINEDTPPQYKDAIDSPYSSQIPVPDDNLPDQLSSTIAFTPELPQTTALRYSNIPDPELEYEYQENAQVTSNNSFLPPTSQGTTYKHRYENVPDSEQEGNDTLETSVPDYSPPLPPKDFLPDQPTSDYINEEPTIPDHQDAIYAINSQHDNLTGTISSSSTLRKSSIPIIVRPTTAPPPPPPPTSIPTQKTEQPAPQTSPPLPIVSPSSPPPPPPIPTEIFIPPPPPPPEYILPETTPNCSETFHRRTSSSGISSTASIPGSPLSPGGTTSKSHLLEQIRQFKQSGKGLKKATENEEQAGTPTRVRRNSIQDALLTRFKAFSGNQSESSEDEQNNVEDDWED